HRVDLAQQARTLHQQFAAGRGEPGLARTAVEQQYVERVLDLAHAVGQRAGFALNSALDSNNLNDAIKRHAWYLPPQRLKFSAILNLAGQTADRAAGQLCPQLTRNASC